MRTMNAMCWRRLAWQRKSKTMLQVQRFNNIIREETDEKEIMYSIPDHRYVEYMIYKDIDERAAWYSPLTTERFTSFSLWYMRYLVPHLSESELKKIVVYERYKQVYAATAKEKMAGSTAA